MKKAKVKRSALIDHRYSVEFAPGSIGLQLEPINDAGRYCRVQRVLEGQPAEGRVDEGDFVVGIDGQAVVSYASAIERLRERAQSRRVLVLERAVGRPGTDMELPAQSMEPPTAEARRPGSLRVTARLPSTPNSIDSLVGDKELPRPTAMDFSVDSKSPRSMQIDRTPDKPSPLRLEQPHPRPESTTKQQLEARIDYLQSQLDSLRHERVQVEKLARDAQGSAADEKATVAVLQERVAALQEQVRLGERSRMTEHATAERKRQQLQGELRDKDEAVARLEQELEQARRLATENGHAEGRRQELQAELSAKDNALARLEQQLAQAKVRMANHDALEQRAAEVHAALAAKEQEVARLQQQVDQAHEFKAIEARLRAEKEQLERRLAAAEDKYRQTEQVVAELRQASAESTLQEQLDRAMLTIKERTDALQRAEREVESMRSTNSSQVNMLRQENQKLRLQVDKTKQELSFATASTARTSGRIAELEKSKEFLERELVSSRRQAESENRELRERVRVNGATMAEFQAQLTKAESTIKSLQSELSLNRLSLATATAAVDDLKADAATMTQEQVAEMEAAGRLIQIQLSQEKGRCLALEREMELLRSTLESKNSDLTSMRMALGQVEGDLAAAVSALEDAEASKSKSTRQLLNLNEQVDLLTDERDRLRGKLDSALVRLFEMSQKAESDLSSGDVDPLQSELFEKEAEIAAAEAKIQELQNANDDLTVTVIDMRRAIARNEDVKLRALLQEREDLSENARHSSRAVDDKPVAHVEDQLAKKEEELSYTRSRLSMVSSEREKLCSDLALAEADLDAAQRKIRKLEQDHADFIAQEKLKSGELEDLIQSKFLEASAACKAQLAVAHSESSGLQEQMRSLDTSRRAWKHQAESLAKANDELNSRIEAFRSTVEEKENILSSMTMELASVKDDLEDARDDVEQKAKEHEACQKALETVQTQYAQLSNRLRHVAEESSKEKNTLLADMITLQEELADAKSRRNELERLLRSMRRNASDSESRLGQAREQLGREREAAREVKRSADETRQALQAKLDRVTSELTASKASVKHIEEERSNLRSNVESLQRKLASLEEELSDAQARLESSETDRAAEIDRLKQEIARQQELVQSFSEKLRNSELQLQIIRREMESGTRNYEDRLRQLRAELSTKSRMHSEILQTKEAELRALLKDNEGSKSAQSELIRSEESLRLCREEIEHLNEFADELRSSHASKMETTINSFRERERVLSYQIQALEADLRTANSRYDDAMGKLAAAEDTVSADRQERERLISEKQEILTSLNQARDLTAELQSELAALQNSSMCSSDDDENQFSGLSKSDLRAKCSEWQRDVQAAKAQLSEARSTESLRTKQMKRLEGDLVLMADEIEYLVRSNKQLEERLKDVRMTKEEAETVAASCRSRLAIEEENVKLLEQQLAEQVNRNLEITNRLAEAEDALEKAILEYGERLSIGEATVAELKEKHELVLAENNHLAESLDTKKAELAAARLAINDKEDARATLELDLSETKARLDRVVLEAESSRVEAATASEMHTKQINELEEECSDLRVKLAVFEVEVETMRVELEGNGDSKRAMSERLDQQRQELQSSESLREEVVAKLAQASRVVQSQKETIAALEQRAEEAAIKSSSLSQQVASLQSTIAHLESSADSNSEFRLEHLEELESKCQLLDTERSAAREEANSMREELRQLRRRANDFEKKCEALQARLDSTKENLDKTKDQLLESRSMHEESAMLAKKMESEAESSRMEAEHLKTKMQLLNATISRLKSDHLLLQEAALQAEFKVSSTESKDNEILQLETELKAKTAKLESLSEVYHSQQQILGLSQSLEERLMRFMEDLVENVDGAFDRISSAANKRHDDSRKSRKLGIRALDLSGLADSTKASMQKELSTVIAAVMDDLSDRRQQLQAWKQQRQPRVAVHTPEAKSRKSLPDTPSIMDALYKIKKTLNEDVLSPVKQTNARLDADYFHKVIRSLEIQIDGLLVDLKSANDALLAKDRLFVDLEQLVVHHESERSMLEKRLEARTARVRDLEERVQREVAWKRAAEQELAQVRIAQVREQQESERVAAPVNDKASRVAAGRLIAKFVENRATADKAHALYLWSRQASVAKAIEEQQLLAGELSQQLGTTKEKLGLLKRHLRRNRRRSSLDSIEEGHGYDTT